VDVFEELVAANEAYFRAAVLQAIRELGPDAPKTRRMQRLLDAAALFDASASGDATAVPPGGWGQLAQVIRDDRPLPLPQQGEELRRYHEHLEETGAAAARELWEELKPEGPLLDLGGGTGTYSRAFPDGDAVLADQPEVLALSDWPRKLSINVTDEAATNPLKGFGTVLLCNVLHLFGPRQVAQVVQLGARGLRSGGRLVVKDLHPGTKASVLFALNMALFTEEGDVHPRRALESWLREAGLKDVQTHALRTSPNSLVLTARAP
jgi:hypothetical protein